MDNTPFSKKCEILHDFYIANATDDYWRDLFDMHDLGFPAAVLVVNGAATLTDIGIIMLRKHGKQSVMSWV